MDDNKSIVVTTLYKEVNGSWSNKLVMQIKGNIVIMLMLRQMYYKKHVFMTFYIEKTSFRIAKIWFSDMND